MPAGRSVIITAAVAAEKGLGRAPLFSIPKEAIPSPDVSTGIIIPVG